VQAVESCISLATCLKGKTEIHIRDEKIVQTVEKIIIVWESLESYSEFEEDDNDNNDKFAKKKLC
jgi:hypothetical protein